MKKVLKTVVAKHKNTQVTIFTYQIWIYWDFDIERVTVEGARVERDRQAIDFEWKVETGEH
jgi:hypothetical protein